jgi:hypothetical protein
MFDTHTYRPADHQSRREIDMAIGVLIGIRRCTAHEALDALVTATRVSGIGLGGVSRTLLSIVSGDVESTTTDTAAAHWNSMLESTVHNGE